MRRWQGCAASLTLSRAAGLHQPVLETWWGLLLVTSASCQIRRLLVVYLGSPACIIPLLFHWFPRSPCPFAQPQLQSRHSYLNSRVVVNHRLWTSQAVAVSLAISKPLDYLNSIAAALDVMHCRCMQTRVLPVHSWCCRQAAVPFLVMTRHMCWVSCSNTQLCSAAFAQLQLKVMPLQRHQC